MIWKSKYFHIIARNNFSHTAPQAYSFKIVTVYK